MELKSRDELPNYFKQLGFTTGAEVGVYRGEFTEKFCKAGLAMYAIDPWIPFKGQGRSEETQGMQDTNYEYTKKRLGSYKNCTLIKKTSMGALNDFRDGSLDFVYLDGDHRFRYVADDIAEWYFKVKKGGIVAGHDYYMTAASAKNLICQVKAVVDAFVATYEIKDFYIFGENDKYLSWMFIKNI